jgi:hypothetical protein
MLGDSMAASQAAAAAAALSPPTVQGRAGSKYPVAELAVGVFLTFVAVGTYYFHAQLAPGIPALVGALIPGFGIAVFVVWTTILVIHGPPDHLKNIPYIGQPGAFFVFALEGVGIYFLGWAGLVQALASQSGGLVGVPSPESWAVPAASGASWFAIAVVVTVYYAVVNLYHPWLARRASGGP